MASAVEKKTTIKNNPKLKTSMHLFCGDRFKQRAVEEILYKQRKKSNHNSREHKNALNSYCCWPQFKRKGKNRKCRQRGRQAENLYQR